MTEHDPVGSAAEEAAKLLGTLAGWARDREAEWGAHLANGEECRYCPICRAVQLFRSASPEVREHLATAATSLAQAAAAALATAVPPDRRSGVEHIDLSDEWPDEWPDEPTDEG
jgi:hypothetical protein